MTRSETQSLRTRLGLGLVAVATSLTITACGGEDKPSKNKAGEPGAEVTGQPPAASTTAGAIAALGTGQANWGDIVKQVPKSPTKPTGEVPTKDNASGVSKAGIAKPISGFGSVVQTGFRVGYAPSQNYDAVKQAFQQIQFFETIANALNRTIKLNRVVDIQMVECGTVNAFYDPNNGRIIVCYELIGYYLEMFAPVAKSQAELESAVLGATFFAFFHELGHGLIHVLDLAAVGREEDSVDQLATLILMEAGDDGVAAAMAGAQWFALESAKKEKTGHAMPFWDEHSLDQQRFFNIACLLFGSNPQKYQNMVKSGILPEGRAVRCPDEYSKISRAWERLLAEHIIEGGGASAGPVATTPPPTNQPPVGGQPPTTQPPVAQPPVAQPPVAQQPGSQPAGTWGNPPAGGQQPGWGGDKPAGNAPTGNSCEAVATHVGQLLIAAFQQQATNLPAEQRQTAEQELTTQLPQFLQNVVQQCGDQAWPEKTRKCVLEAKDLQSADQCGV